MVNVPAFYKSAFAQCYNLKLDAQLSVTIVYTYSNYHK